MLAKVIAVTALAVGTVAAEALTFYSLNAGFSSIGRRQQYKPPPPQTCSGPGDTCETACGAGSQWCSEPKLFCFNPTLAESCCEAGTLNAWSCPDGDYCLIDGYCCPRDQDPKDCAKAFSVTLPPTFSRTLAPLPTQSYDGSAPPPAETTSSASYANTTTTYYHNVSYTTVEPTTTTRGGVPTTVVTAAADAHVIPAMVGVVAIVGAMVFGQAF